MGKDLARRIPTEYLFALTIHPRYRVCRSADSFAPPVSASEFGWLAAAQFLSSKS